ncbi:MAG: hypothetical protein SOR72_01710 [Hornefia sp.]|nr:hypothetical protein [Hornefia sp.]
MNIKKSIICLLSLIMFTIAPLQVFAINSHDDTNLANFDSNSKSEVLKVDNKIVKYVTSENENSRIIRIFDANNNLKNTIYYDKLTSNIFLDNKKIEFTYSEEKIVNSNYKLLAKSKWKYLNTKRFKFSIGKNVAKAVVIGMIASAAGGPVAAFLGAYAVWKGFHTNCSGIVKWYIRKIGHKTQKKGACDVYWGRNWNEYFYSTIWYTTPH